MGNVINKEFPAPELRYGGQKSGGICLCHGRWNHRKENIHSIHAGNMLSCLLLSHMVAHGWHSTKTCPMNKCLNRDCSSVIWFSVGSSLVFHHPWWNGIWEGRENATASAKHSFNTGDPSACWVGWYTSQTHWYRTMIRYQSLVVLPWGHIPAPLLGICVILGKLHKYSWPHLPLFHGDNNSSNWIGLLWWLVEPRYVPGISWVLHLLARTISVLRPGLLRPSPADSALWNGPDTGS